MTSARSATECPPPGPHMVLKYGRTMFVRPSCNEWDTCNFASSSVGASADTGNGTFAHSGILANESKRYVLLCHTEGNLFLFLRCIVLHAASTTAAEDEARARGWGELREDCAGILMT